MATDPLVLVRATADTFDQLEANWHGQLEANDDSPEDYYAAMMAHARKIANEDPPDPKYGIFVLTSCDGDGQPIGPYEGLVHVNHKLPLLPGTELRMVWHLLAPHYQYQDPIDIGQLSHILTRFLVEGLNLAMTDMVAPSMKWYMQNTYDRQFGRLVATWMTENTEGIDVAFAGNWLHIKLTQD